MDERIMIAVCLMLALQVITFVLLLQWGNLAKRSHAEYEKYCRKYNEAMAKYQEQQQKQDDDYERYSKKYNKNLEEYLRSEAEYEEKRKEWDKQLERLTNLMDKWEETFGKK